MKKMKQLLTGLTVLSLLMLTIPSGHAESMWFATNFTLTTEKTSDKLQVTQAPENSYNYTDEYANITFNFYNFIYSPDFRSTYSPARVENGTVQINATSLESSNYYYDMNIDPKFDNMTFTRFDYSVNGQVRSTTWNIELYSLYIDDAPLGLNHISWKLYTNTSVTITIPIDIEVRVTDNKAPSLSIAAKYNDTVLHENDKINLDSGTTTLVLSYDAKIADKQSVLGNFWIFVNKEQTYKHRIGGQQTTCNGTLELGIGYYSIYFYASDTFNNTSYQHYQINILQNALPALSLDYPFSFMTSIVVITGGAIIRRNFT